MNLSTVKKVSKLGWNSRVCGGIRIIDYLGIDKQGKMPCGI
jgi:hypothetical protein